jgi:hypothetical protein
MASHLSKNLSASAQSYLGKITHGIYYMQEAIKKSGSAG